MAARLVTDTVNITSITFPSPSRWMLTVFGPADRQLPCQPPPGQSHVPLALNVNVVLLACHFHFEPAIHCVPFAATVSFLISVIALSIRTISSAFPDLAAAVLAVCSSTNNV